jgi:flagellar hook-length control protein FliK
MASPTRIDRSDLAAHPAAQAARARSQVREEAADARRERARFTLEENRQDARAAESVAARRAARQAPERSSDDTAQAPSAPRAPTQQPSADKQASTALADASTKPSTRPASPRRETAQGDPRDAAAAPSSANGPSAADGGSAEVENAKAPAARPASDGRDGTAADGVAEKPEPSASADSAPAPEIVLPAPSAIQAIQPTAAQPPVATTAATPSASATAEPTAAIQGRPEAGRPGQVEAGPKIVGADEAAGARAAPEAAGGPAPRADRDAVQNLLAPATGARATETAAPAHAAAPTRAADTTAPTPLRAVPIEVGLKALEGTSRFDIRLDPVELGRIDVRLDIDQDTKRVKAHLIVDRPETLQLLQRDAGLVEQAIAQAGLTPSPDGLGLTLRDPGGGQGGAQDGGRQSDQPGRHHTTETKAEDAAPAARMTVRAASGLDIRI